MLIPSNFEGPDKGRETPAGLLGLVTPEIIAEHLHEVKSLDAVALRETLVPHRVLPTQDPAGYLMAYRSVITPSTVHETLAPPLEPHEPVSMQSSYGLGVMFASSLIKKAQKDSPVSSQSVIIDEELNLDKKRLIQDYLKHSYEQSAGHPTKNSEIDLAIQHSLADFVEWCKEVMPALVSGGSEEVIRGCGDYISVVALLEADQTQHKSLLKLFLGKSSVSNRMFRRR